MCGGDGLCVVCGGLCVVCGGDGLCVVVMGCVWW